VSLLAYVCYYEGMTQPQRIDQGFTIIELIVVIAVIGILATITTLGLSRFQSDTRDAQRVSKATVIADALEKYYDINGEYPSCSTLTQTADVVTTTVLPGIDTTTLVAPQASNGTTNSIICQDIASTASDVFAYSGDGSADCDSGSSCLEWKITYRDEGDNSLKTITSRRKTDIATSNRITDLTASNPGISTVTLAWTASSGAVSYQIQTATNNTFTSGLISSTATTNSATIAGLAGSTPYFFRVTPVSLATTTGASSNIATSTTLQLGAPTCSGTTDSYSQVTFSWTAPAYAITYNVQYSPSATFSNSVTAANGLSAPLTTAVSALSPNTTLYFRAQSVNGTTSSSWCATTSAATTIPAPSSTTAITNSATQITAGWSAVPAVDSYTLQYSTSNSFSSPTTITDILSTSRALPSLNQGQQYFIRVFAVVSGASSAASPSANATTTINQPATPNTQFISSWKNNQRVVVNYVTYCPAGTSVLNGNYTSRSWAGSYFYHGFGFNDWWTLGPGGGATVEYWGRYACQTAFATSVASPDRYSTIWVYP
jgi:prepilin-type N-terminal cleavage/methylation domain-containing protein